MGYQIIESFIPAAEAVFQSMAGSQVKAGKPQLRRAAKLVYPLTGIVCLASEKVKGMLMISMEPGCLIEISGRFRAEKFNQITPDVIDSLAELAALIAERARADLRGHGIEVYCSAPMVLRAHDAQLSTLATAPIDSVPMECSFGKVLLEAFVG